MRLFIAIQLSQEMKESLIDLQNDWYDAGIRGNYSSEENLHLTIAFIGEVPDPQPVLNAMKTVRFTPIPLSLEGVGAFGDLWWVGLEKSPTLQAVAKRIRFALANNGISFDRKKFNPHITLLRKASMREIPPIGISPASMTADEIFLIRSDRGKEGMIYTEIGSIQAAQE